MATHFSILAWRIPWTEESGGLQSMGLQTVRHDLATKHHHSILRLINTFWFFAFSTFKESLPSLLQGSSHSWSVAQDCHQLASILTLTSQLHEQVEYGGLLLLSSCPPLAPKYGVQRESELVNTFTFWERGPPQFHGTFPDLTLCLHLTVHLCLF